MHMLETRLRYVPASHIFGLHKLQVPLVAVQFDRNVPLAAAGGLCSGRRIHSTNKMV